MKVHVNWGTISIHDISVVCTQSACTLNRRQLPALNGGKLTVTLVQSAKIRVPMMVYLASRNRIEQARKTWNEQYLSFHVYSDAAQRFSPLKVEGEKCKERGECSQSA